MTQTQKTIGYLLLIVIGWGIGEYPYIPTFQLGFISHVQPDYTILDKCVSITLLAFSLGLFFALWHNLWLMIVMIFITWGMFNNAVDEWTNQAELFGDADGAYIRRPIYHLHELAPGGVTTTRVVL